MRIEGLPLFPLANVVLFPGMLLPLRIFESRYRTMVSQCLADDARFGVALISEGQEVGGPAEVHSVGTIARILTVGRYDDGQMDLMTVGVQRFRILQTDSSKPYLCGCVELLRDGREEPESLQSRAADVLALLREYRSMLEYGENAPELPEDPEALSYIAGVLDLPATEKQVMLESLSTSDRLLSLGGFLRREIQMLSVLGPTRSIVRGPGQAPHN